LAFQTIKHKSLKQTQPHKIFKGIFHKKFENEKKNYKKNKTWLLAEQKNAFHLKSCIYQTALYVLKNSCSFINFSKCFKIKLYLN